MKTFLLSIFLFGCSTQLLAQRYKTLGIVQYQKNISGSYSLIHQVRDYEATWTFNIDNTFHCYREGQNCGDYTIKKKTKAGARTIYIVDLLVVDVKIIIENGYLTWFEGEDYETKNVYRIIKTEKIE